MVLGEVVDRWKTDPVTTRTQQTYPGGWLRVFLAALVAALAAILLGTTASASAAVGAETRVGAFNVADEVLVGPPQHVSAGQGRVAAEKPAGIVVATGVAANAGARLEIQLGTKIEGQAAKRGWSRESVEDLINNPSRTVATRDTRHLPGGGRNDAPATGYINRSGGYVVRNDETGDIVQVSNLNDPNWKSPW